VATETGGERNIVIEQYKKFSKSCLWKLQRDYFDQEGINAWVNQVPFFITSNPFIAHSYAAITMAFISDVINANPDARAHPFYILELGTGSGRFSYYVVKRLLELRRELGLEDVQFCYVMSDFTKNNIKYYETHPALKAYVEQGIIDFAIYDMEQDRPITLLKKNIRLNQDILHNPLITFANYIFDTVSHDSFTVSEGKLHELLLSVSTPESNMSDNLPVNMEKLSIDFRVQEIKDEYYGDPQLDKILEHYRKNLLDTSFLFPIGGIRAIQYLKKLAHDKLFIIASDKGYNTIAALDRLGYPSLSFHGSFSMMVNFHALANYFKNTGGDAFLQTARKGIKTSVFCSSYRLSDMKKTRLAIQEYVEGFSPADYFTLHRRMSDTFQECTLDMLAAHLNLSRWDPHIYLKMASRVITQIEDADSDTISFLAKNMENIAANYYYMPKSDCVLFEIAVFFHSIKRYQEALDYYKKAQGFIGDQFGLYYNMALCLQNVGFNDEALTNFHAALKMEPDSKEAKEWIEYLEKNEG
jgi:tetratricopeptide (TPR) repeat protein